MTQQFVHNAQKLAMTISKSHTTATAVHHRHCHLHLSHILLGHTILSTTQSINKE